MTTVWVEAISVFGPGLPGWNITKDILRGKSVFDPTSIPPIESRFLTPTNKRRTSPHMHIAIQAADHVLSGTGVDETDIELIFSSSEGDLDIAEDNLQALIHPQKEMSPQKFQNVILNAAAGHLGIFMKNRSGSTTVSGTDNCFSVGLLQTYTSIMVSEKNALLVAYDAPSNMPYAKQGRTFFSVGMLLTKARPEKPLAGLSMQLIEPRKNNFNAHPEIAEHYATTPSATCLPLLTAIANEQVGFVQLYYSGELALLVSLCF